MDVAATGKTNKLTDNIWELLAVILCRTSAIGVTLIQFKKKMPFKDQNLLLVGTI